MAAVVTAMRILGDSELRVEYDDLRSERLSSRVSPMRSDNAEIHVSDRTKHKKSRSTYRPSKASRYQQPPSKTRFVSPDAKRGAASRAREYRDESLTDSTMDMTLESNVPTSNTTYGESTLDMTDEGTIMSDAGSTYSEGTLTTYRKGFAGRIHDEVLGALEDTTMSFQQILHVFTLREEDIKAVTGRIHKAKRQMQRSI